MSPRKYDLPGHGTFWLDFDGELGPETDSPLMPLEHCDETGELDLRTCFASDSYADMRGGIIMRYGVQIGTWRDLHVHQLPTGANLVPPDRPAPVAPASPSSTRRGPLIEP